MVIYDQLPVYKAVYDLLIQLFEITKKMERNYKFTIGEKSGSYKFDCQDI